jgi:lipoprotein NlpI
MNGAVMGLLYWSLGFVSVGRVAYDHSMKLKPNATAFFNLALRYDDMGNEEAAVRSLKKFYELAGSEK